MAEYRKVLRGEWSEQNKGQWAEQASIWAEQHRDRARLATLRAELYASSCRRQALTNWVRMVLSGVYVQQGKCRVASAAKDGLRSVCRPPIPPAFGESRPL